MSRTRRNAAAPPAAAASWVDHLREGGTTRWGRWARAGEGAHRAHGSAVDDTADPASRIPGAAQLELLRRLNELGPLPHRVDHVLGRPGPGRGPVHLRLPATGRAAPRHEVLRVAAGVLADLTAELPARPPRRRRRPRRPRPVEGLPTFVLEGPPITAGEVRAGLAAAGVVEHQPRFSWLGTRPDPGPELAVVLAGPLDAALSQVWSSRVQRGAARAWPRFATHWAGRRALPPSAAVDRVVDYWATRLGAGNVHLVTLDPDTDPLLRVGMVLGRPAGSGPAVDAGQPARLAPAVVDVIRRVNVVLPFVCPSPDRTRRLAALVELARGEPARREPPDPPRRVLPWVGATTNAIADTLAATRCPVHGDLDTLRRVAPPTGRRIDGREVLDVMVRLIHRADAEVATRRKRGGR